MAKGDAERVWDLVEKIGFCMLSTHDGEDIRARPMAAYVDRDERAIYFLTDSDSSKDEDIERNPIVGLAFADAGDQKYASISGHATVSNDRQKIRELWSTPAKAWWNKPGRPLDSGSEVRSEGRAILGQPRQGGELCQNVRGRYVG